MAEALHGWECTKCEMFITKAKFDSIVNNVRTRRFPMEEDPDKRLSELNNLGRNLESDNYDQPDN